jgi:hypothetical protein
MAQKQRVVPERAMPRRIFEDDTSSDGPWINASACQGIPPIVIESPLPFFGVQLIAGLASILTLLLAEVLR